MGGVVFSVLGRAMRLLERDETGGVGGTNTGSTVLDGFAVEIVLLGLFFSFAQFFSRGGSFF